MKTVLCALVLMSSVAAVAEISHLRRVDDHVYRGRQPDKAGFAELKKMGIKTVLDLRGGPIHEPRERRDVEAAGMQYISMRLSGIWEPKDQQIANILAVLENPARWPIFIHCRRGDDRVGEVIACYRMAYDHWTDKQAMDEARQDGISRFEPLMRAYVRHFDVSRVQRLMPTATASAVH